MTTIRLLAASLAFVYTAAAAAEDIPFTLFKTDIIVDVRIGDRTLAFVVDTGISEGNILSAQTANELGLEPEGRAAFGDSAGRQGAMPLTTVDEIRVGDTVLRDQEFAVARLPEELKRRPGEHYNHRAATPRIALPHRPIE
jgi:predicted aspartyl protease